MKHRNALGFEFSTGFEGYEDVTFSLPKEATRNLRLWLTLYDVEPTDEAQSLVVEALLFQLANGSVDEGTHFHFGEFTEVADVELPDEYWQRSRSLKPPMRAEPEGPAYWDDPDFQSLVSQGEHEHDN